MSRRGARFVRPKAGKATSAVQTAGTGESPVQGNVPGYLNPFTMLLAETLALHDLSDDYVFDDPLRSAVLAKACILSAALSVECAAYCCLAAFDMSEEQFENADRLSTLEKFQATHHILTKRKLPLGIPPVQRIREVTLLRDRLVHAKIVEVPLTVVDSPTALGKKEFRFDDERFRMLDIPCNPTVWRWEHSAKVLKAVIEFFNFFFIQSCKLRVDQVRECLYTKIPGGIYLNDFELEHFRRAGQGAYEVKLRFLGFD
jgi:hypothetical protein